MANSNTTKKGTRSTLSEHQHKDAVKTTTDTKKTRKRGPGGKNPNDPTNSKGRAIADKTKMEETAKKKATFLEIFERSMCIVATSCKHAGISRQLFYDWCKNDPEFAERVSDVEELQKDFGEAALLKRIKEGDSKMIRFYAETRLKDRGYTKKHELDIKHVDDLDLSALTNDELQVYSSLLEKMKKRE